MIKKNNEIYNLIKDHLEFDGKWEEIDHHLIEQLQDTYNVYQHAKNKVYEDGPVQVTKTGYTQKSGMYSVMQDAQKDIITIQTKLGVYAIFGDKLKYIQKTSTKGKNPLDEI